MISAMTLSMALLLAGRPRPEPQPEPEPSSTERWYSIHHNENHVGYVRMDRTPRADGLPGVDFIADFTVQSLYAIPEITIDMAGEGASPLISYAYEATLNDKFEFDSGRATVSIGGIVVESRISRAEDRWSIMQRLPDGTQGNLAGMVRTPYYFFYEALMSKAEARELVSGATLHFEEIGTAAEQISGIRWTVRVGDRVTAEIGPQEQFEMIQLEMEARPYGQPETLTVSVQVDSDGRLCSMRYPVQQGPGRGVIVIRWERDRMTANNGREPFARNGRGDPFHRGLARRLVTEFVVPPDDAEAARRLAEIERLESDFLAAHSEGRDDVVQSLWIQITTLESTYSRMVQQVPRDQQEQIAQLAARATRAVNTALSVWNFADAITTQFDSMYDGAVAMLNAESATTEDPALEELFRQMRQLANDRRLVEHPALQQQFNTRLELLTDRRLVARLQNRIRASRPNPARANDPFVIEGFALALDDEILPMDIGVGLMGARIEWTGRVRVYRPHGEILITGMIFREGMTVDLGLLGEPGDPVPLEIYRIEQDRVIFRAQGRLEIPIPYPVGGFGVRGGSNTGTQGGRGR